MPYLPPWPNVRRRLLPIGWGCAALASVGGAVWVVVPAAQAAFAPPPALEAFKATYAQIRCLNDLRAAGKVADRWTGSYDPRLITYDMRSAGCPGPLATVTLAEVIETVSRGPPLRRRDIVLLRLRSRLEPIGAGWVIEHVQPLLSGRTDLGSPSDGEGYTPYD